MRNDVFDHFPVLFFFQTSVSYSLSKQYNTCVSTTCISKLKSSARLQDNMLDRFQNKMFQEHIVTLLSDQINKNLIWKVYWFLATPAGSFNTLSEIHW